MSRKGRPARGTEDVFFDTFSDWTFEDQAAALKVLTALHRQKQRETRRVPVTGAHIGPVQEGIFVDPPEA